MRNLKKILALVLALVMSFSLLATANAFTDSQDIDGTYEEAVEVLSALKVFQGYENGSFQPKGEITRAEVAAIIYRIVTGDVTDKQVGIYADYNKFDDVKSTSWYAGYVNFCANAEIIKGYNATTFGPNDKVTGYQALAMILRAIGYDKNNEFTGSGWQVQTAAVGKKLGVTDNVNDGTLNTPATREVVAEILFQTILVPQVEYTVAFGYQSYGQNTLGYETFKLVGAVSGADEWGRPAKVWKLDKDSDKVAESSDTTLVSLPYEAAASYTTAVDECDIAKDLGISNSAAIEAAYIDGVEVKTTERAVTTNLVGTINARATTSYVGAQGRQTYVYDMGVKGYRIVEINTYLAKVVGVTAEKVDKNGHVTPAYVTFEVYADNASVGAPKASVITATRNLIYNTADYVVGEYALVTVSESSLAGGKVATAEKTTAVATGVLRGYTASTTRVGEETYNDADLFVLGNAKITDSYGKTYDVFVDQYGNVIGLVPTANNYLVIEAIRWIHDGTLYGGSALANVVLADGSRVENVTIASVAGRLTTNTGDAFGDADSATVSDYYTNNGEYYNHLASYVVNADGTYAITSLKDDTTAADNDTVCAAADLDNVAITKGLTTMVSKTNTVVANDNTVFLVKQSNGTYETYVGKNNVPSMTDATICYLTSNGYATVVLVTKYTLASNSFVAYVPAETTARLATDWYYGVYNGRYAYEVYKVGETEPTTIYSNDADLFKFSQISTLGDRDGFYDITVDANGVVTSSVRFIGTYAYDTVTNITTAHGGYLWDRAWVRTNLVGNSLQTADKAGTTANKDFFVDNAKYFVITRVTLPTGSTYTTVTEGSAADMVAGTKVIVAYTNAANNPAAYVYVIAAEGAAVDPAQDKYTVHSTANPWPVTVNNVGVIAPTCYTNIVAAGGTGADALAGAMANATKLSLRSLTAVATGEYKIQASGMTTGVITVWQTSAQVPVAINVTTAANTAEWQGTLAVGNYVVIADASAAGTANYYAVYEIVE